MNRPAEPRVPLRQMRERIVEVHRSGEHDEARRLYGRYLTAHPGDAGMWTNLGALLRQTGRYDLAIAAHRRGLEIEPDSLTIRSNLCNVLNDVGQYEEALEIRRAVCAARPDDPEAVAMMGKTLRSMGRHDEAERTLEAGIARHPDYAELRIQLALSQLKRGNYRDGFANFAARWETGELKPKDIPAPKWDGGPLDGKRILVMPEQGFGDFLSMTRFLPLLKRRGAGAVVVLAERPLARLLARHEGVDRTATEVRRDDIDTWVYAMDLPAMHFAEREEVPPPPGLAVPEDSVERAATILRPFRDRLKVGVVWTGSVTYRANAFRSMSHADLHPLTDVPGVQLFSLYKGPKLDEYLADGTANLILDLGSHDRDFADCAAIMQGLDLVITTCTVTAHLAGTLGVPVWIMLHWDSFWMWGREGETTPWYPSARLFRQRTPRDWSGVIAEVRGALAERAKTREVA